MLRFYLYLSAPDQSRPARLMLPELPVPELV